MDTLAKSTSTPNLAATTRPGPKLNVAAIPNLPGTQISNRLGQKHFPRQNSWSIIGGCRIERDRAEFEQSRGKFVRAPKTFTPYRQGSLPSTTTKDVFAKPSLVFDELPAWEMLDRHVLRFYGYGKESVCETNLENYRVKKFKFLYYLQDDTVQISMPEPDNSGCGVFSAIGGQGDKGLSANFLKRGKLRKADGTGFVTPDDFKIGEDFNFLGRKVRIYDCDKFTEEYYARLGKPQNMALAEPEAEKDAFAETLAKKNIVPSKPERTNEKIYYENMLNGGHINANMQQFMEKDRMVCRFYAIVDDLITPQYERRPFVIMYFLANDTIQIREQYPLNSGRDGFPLFCKRMRMPKGKTELRGPMDSAYQEDEYVHITDFKIGQRVEMYNTSFYIYDADGFTREYFEKESGFTPLPTKIDVRLPEKEVPRAPTPPYTGYGTWDDSMGSVIQLIPKKPKKDLAKLFFNEGKTLRFSAKFSGEVSEEDTMRRFLMTYNLFDDTVMIHEPPQRNLGIVTGRFLEKAVHLNQLTGKLFRPDDFLPGNEIKCQSHQFLMLDMDEYTRNYFKSLENGEEMYRNNVNLNQVLQQLREQMTNQFPQIRDVFRRFDADRNGVLCYHEMERALQKFGFLLSPEETLCVMKHFDPDATGQINYQQFCDKVLDPDFFVGNLMVKPELEINAAELAEYADVAAQKTVERAETEKVRRAVRTIGDIFFTRENMRGRLLAEYNEMGQEPTKTWDQIRLGFLKLGYSFDLTDVQRCITFCLPGCDLQKVPVIDFLHKLKVTYHDMYLNR